LSYDALAGIIITILITFIVWLATKHNSQHKELGDRTLSLEKENIRISDQIDYLTKENDRYFQKLEKSKNGK